MATTIVTKNSSTASAVPTAAQLVQGELAVNVADKRLYTEDNAGAIVELGTNPSTIDINSGTIDGTTIGASSASTGAFTTLTASGEITANGGIALGDNDKATFGASDDLQIYHDGGNTFINEGGTGSLYIQARDLYLRDYDTSVSFINMLSNSAVTLHHAGNAKLATTATGIDVTGTATMDGLVVDGGGSFTMAGGGLKVLNNGTAGYNANIFFGLPNQTDGWTIGQGITANDGVFRLYDNGGAGVKMSATAGGDISFYEDTGTTAKLFWDASAESLGIGTSSFVNNNAKFVVSNGTVDIEHYTDTGAGIGYVGTRTNHDFGLLTNGTPKLYITTAGNVGIGNSSPSAKFTNYKNTSISGSAGATLSLEDDSQPRMMMVADSSASYISSFDSNPITFSVTAGNFAGSTGTERMRIDSSGNVGIGNSSPSNYTGASANTLVVGSNSGNNGITVAAGTTGYSSIAFADSAGAGTTADYSGLLQYYHNTDTLNIFTAGAERMRIDNNGNVGIGTTSPQEKTHSAGRILSTTQFGGATQRIGTSIGENGNTRADIDFRRWTGAAANHGVGMIEVADTGVMAFYTDSKTSNTPATSERMRIDASGNLLVGGTSAFGADTITLGTGGFAGIRNTSGSCLELRRDSTDGSLLDFQKDGTTVGSIGVTSGSIAFGQSNTALGAFNTDRLLFPATSVGAVQDNAIDLGYSGGRFKDLYLSGGVYLGGTGAANKLDDYETGSWTPNISVGTHTYTVQTGTYTKVGNLVTVKGEITLSSRGSSSDELGIGGLPFAAGSGPLTGNFNWVSAYAQAALFGATILPTGLSVEGNIAYARRSQDYAVSYEVNSLASSGNVRFSMVYTTNA